MSLFLRRRPRPAGNPHASRRARRAHLTLHSLESRITPYSLSGYSWADPNVSFSFIPDGTPAEGSTSSLFSLLNATAPTATWQREVARALQSWAEVSRLNFRLINDPGDIRVGAVPQSGSLGYSYYPTGSSLAGDVFLSPAYQFQIGANYDLYSVVLHEFGHSLGLRHSDVSDAVMAPIYLGLLAGLRPDDVAGIQAIYGARQPDTYDAAAANDTLATATALGLSGSGLSVTADLTGRADADYYRVTALGGSLTVSVDARNRSLLAPRVMVYDAAGAVVGSATADYGQAATVALTGLTAGQTCFLAVDGATDDALGTGAYALTAQFGDSPAPAPAPPLSPAGLSATPAASSRVDLTWTDQSDNEAGFRVEQSTDGTTFAFVANVGSNTTGYSVTGLSASTTYYFRVRAYNAVGDSAWSNTAQATTPTAPPPSLSADRFEVNNKFATAKGLGKLTSTSQTGLTLHTASDVDYFSFTAKSGGTFNVSIRFTNATGNLDLYVYNGQQRLLASGTSTADNESVSISCLTGKKYFVRVVSPDGGMNSYDLVIATSGALTDGGGSGPASRVSGGEADGGRFPSWEPVITPAVAAWPPEVARFARTEGPARSRDWAAWAAARAEWQLARAEWVMASSDSGWSPAAQSGPGPGWILGYLSADAI